MNIEQQSPVKFPHILMNHELDDLCSQKGLRSLEEASDVIIFSEEFRPLAHYEKEVFGSDITYRKVAIK